MHTGLAKCDCHIFHTYYTSFLPPHLQSLIHCKWRSVYGLPVVMAGIIMLIVRGLLIFPQAFVITETVQLCSVPAKSSPIVQSMKLSYVVLGQVPQLKVSTIYSTWQLKIFVQVMWSGLLVEMTMSLGGWGTTRKETKTCIITSQSEQQCGCFVCLHWHVHQPLYADIATDKLIIILFQHKYTCKCKTRLSFDNCMQKYL